MSRPQRLATGAIGMLDIERPQHRTSLPTMERRERETLMGLARFVAATGDHEDWRGVARMMLQYSYFNATTLFLDASAGEEIDDLCKASRVVL
jgi:hypothetical protein